MTRRNSNLKKDGRKPSQPVKVVIHEPPSSPPMPSPIENPSFSIELVELGSEKGGASPSPGPKRKRSILGALGVRSSPVGSNGAGTLTDHEKEIVRSKSIFIEQMRKEAEEQKAIQIEKQFKAHDSKPYHRRFYCSDLCRKQTQEMLNDADSGVFAAIYGWVLVVTILLSYFMAITETVRDTAAQGEPYNRKNLRPNKYLIAQVIFISIFTLDTLARIAVADNWFFYSKEVGTTYHGHLYKNAKPFFRDFWNWIDVLSIVLVFIFGFSASFFIVLRVFRPVRNLSQFRIISETLATSARLLSITTFFLISVMVFVAMVILSLESCYNVNCQFSDGFNTLYFIVITMTSVGFGDQIPTAMPARLMAVLAMIIGSFYLAMPLAIVGDRFDKAWEDYQYKESLKRTDAENKILREIEDSQVTSEHRKKRVLIHSYQVLDAINSTLSHMRAMKYNEQHTKRTLLRSFSRLFNLTGKMVEDLLVLYPSYAPTPKFKVVKNDIPVFPSTLKEGVRKRRSRSKKLLRKLPSIKLISESAADERLREEARFDVQPLTNEIDEEKSGGKVETEEVKPVLKRSSTSINLKEKQKSKSLHHTHPHTFDAVLEGVHFFKAAQDSTEENSEKKALHRRASNVSSVTKGTQEPTTYDGIPLIGSYWERQFENREKAKARDIEKIENAKKSGALGRWVQAKQYISGAVGSVVNCICKENRVNEEDVIHEAQVNNHWRSKLWLLMESPESSKSAFVVRIVRLVMTSLALGLVLAESMPELNAYGEDSRSCRNVVNWYCEWVTSCHSSKNVFGSSNCENLWSPITYTQEEINALNQGCFANETLGYGGCLGDMDGDFSQCDFPNKAAGMTMDRADIIFGDQFVNYLGKRGESKYRIGSRLQCINTVANTKSERSLFVSSAPETFFIFEVLFVIFFAAELTLRLVAATAPKDLSWSSWFSEFANWIDLLSVAIALVEIIGNATVFQAPKYQVWGWMGMSDKVDPATFRVLRVIVAVRFMLQQRFFKDTRIVTDTIREVAARLTVPLVLFFLLASMFGGLLFYVEGGILYRCEDFDNPSTLPGSAPSAGVNGTKANCELCGGPPLIVPFGNPLGSSLYPSMPSYSLDWSDEWLGHEEWYNSSCRFLHEAVGKEGTTGVGSVYSLQPPLIIDAFDGLWTIIVTMTTVGYGGKRPHTSFGKTVVAIAALFGAFYLAMPLSIIATAFNKNYLIRLEADKKAQIRRQRQELMQSGKLKFMHIVKLKLWAKRAVERAKGHSHGSGHIAAAPTQVIRYVKALHLVSFFLVSCARFCFFADLSDLNFKFLSFTSTACK